MEREGRDKKKEKFLISVGQYRVRFGKNIINLKHVRIAA